MFRLIGISYIYIYSRNIRVYKQIHINIYINTYILIYKYIYLKIFAP